VAASKKVKSDSTYQPRPRPSRRGPRITVAKSPAKKRVAGGATLVVVESPPRPRHHEVPRRGLRVKASVGHVKDLPKASMGIDVKHDFPANYVVIEGKKKVIADIKAAAKKAGQVLLAPDPDREGEAIAWHIAEEIRPANPNIHRVLFNEITKKAVNEAILHPLDLDRHKFESQQARRVLDRLVGTRSACAVVQGCGAVCRRVGCNRWRCVWWWIASRDQAFVRRSTGPFRSRWKGARRPRL